MHSKIILLFALICVGFLPGCEKEDEQSPFQMKAGEIDPDGYYFDFQPDIVLQANEVGCLYYSDTVLLDLDNDSLNDIRILFWANGLSLSGCDCCDCINGSCYGPMGGDEHKKIEILSDRLQLASDSLGFTISLDSSSVINEFLSWHSIKDQFLSEVSHNPILFYFKGNWNHYNTRFIGFRFLYPSDTLYGWIRVNPSNTITIMDLALEAQH